MLQTVVRNQTRGKHTHKLSTTQIQFTSDVTKTLIVARHNGNRAALRARRKRQLQTLEQLSHLVRHQSGAAGSHSSGGSKEPHVPPSAVDRARLQALLLVEVHARDVIERLVRSAAADPMAFDWQSQLRTYWDKDKDECCIRQNRSEFLYGYEYIGNPGRLVREANRALWYTTNSFSFNSAVLPSNIYLMNLHGHFKGSVSNRAR